LGKIATADRAATIPEYAQHFVESGPIDGGFRLLMAGASGAIDPSDEAIDLVAELSDSGARVLLVDWSLDGRQLHTDIDASGAASLVDLMAGAAEFDDILVTLPDSNVHYAYSTTEPGRPELHDEESLNLILDALDEAYDHVVIAGRYDDARALFEAIQGRFDAGMTIGEVDVGMPLPTDSSFLGFDVADIEIIHYVRSVAGVAADKAPVKARRRSVKQRT
jgi:hypothetical protein